MSGVLPAAACLGLAQQLLQLVLGQQTVVLHKGRHLRGSLRLVVDCAVDLHVSVQDLEEVLLPLQGQRGGIKRGVHVKVELVTLDEMLVFKDVIPHCGFVLVCGAATSVTGSPLCDIKGESGTDLDSRLWLSDHSKPQSTDQYISGPLTSRTD